MPQRSRRHIALGLLFALVAGSLRADDKGAWPREVRRAGETIKARECLDHVKYLASDELEGRECGSEGGRRASEYIAEQFRRMGLEPGGVDGTFFQPFSVRMKSQSEGSLELANRLVFYRELAEKKPTDFALVGDFVPHEKSAERSVCGPLVVVDPGGNPTVPVQGAIGLVPAAGDPPDLTAFTAWIDAGLLGLVLLESETRRFES
ncbi:MAG: hypothetical protein KDC38_07135, partial [Planctomycetes bacterium]|nr:hypothetical protein [Planctomycetota bacterium]